MLEHQAELAKTHGYADEKKEYMWRASVALVENNYSSIDELQTAADLLAGKIISRYDGLSAQEVICVVNESNDIMGKCKRAVLRNHNVIHRATYIVVHDADENICSETIRRKITVHLCWILVQAVLCSGMSPTS